MYFHNNTSSAPILNGCVEQQSSLSSARTTFASRYEACNPDQAASEYTTEIMPKSDVIHTFAEDLVKNMFSARVHRGTLGRSI